MRLRALISRRSPSPPKPSVVTRGLIEWFDFADGKGTETTLKSRVSDNVLTLSGFNADVNSGWTGKGLRFDGVDDSCVYSGNLLDNSETINEFSISLVFKSNTAIGYDFSFRVLSTENTKGVYTYKFFRIEGGRYGYRVFIRSNSESTKVVPQEEVEDKLLTYVFERSAGDEFSVKTYVNDILKGEDAVILTKSDIETGAFRLFSALNSSATYSAGCLSCLCIYNVALTEEEIAQNYEYEQSIDRTTASTYPLLQEQKSYGIGLSNQLSEEQKATFRLSVDGTKFVAGLRYCEGLEVEEFTYSEIQVEMEKEEWSKIEELE